VGDGFDVQSWVQGNGREYLYRLTERRAALESEHEGVVDEVRVLPCLPFFICREKHKMEMRPCWLCNENPGTYHEATLTTTLERIATTAEK
jgi:hypothetical protein